MIVRLANTFRADAVELAVPDVAAAHALVRLHRPDVDVLLAQRRARLLAAFGPQHADLLARGDDAQCLALARLGTRHGSWGNDFHHYHNENHALEVLDNRLGRLLDHLGVNALACQDWLALALFATCHDLRQREHGDLTLPVGNNEAASIAETSRILLLAGFDPVRDRGVFVALELMIAGSTFDARPAPPHAVLLPPDAAVRGGPLAPNLDRLLDNESPGWRDDADITHGLKLARIASDLDTANVAEPLLWLAESASRLCLEREMRAGRSLDDPASAAPCASFLGDGQARYFFDLHRFCSDAGRDTFDATKQANAAPLRAIADTMRSTWGAPAPDATGRQVLEHFCGLALRAGS